MSATYEQQPQQHYAPQPRNGFGITALVLALIGAVFGLVPFTGFIALILGALAVLFGLLGLGRVRKGVATNRVMTIVSTVLGVGVAALGIWGITIVFGAVEQLDRDFQELSGDFETVAPVTPGVAGTADKGALSDVAVSACSTRTEYGMTTAEATVTITNSTDQPRSYWSTIAVDDPSGNRLGEIHAIANQLQPGQATELAGMEASTMLNGPADNVTCSVVAVDRY